jgi:hypothetical protein
MAKDDEKVAEDEFGGFSEDSMDGEDDLLDLDLEEDLEFEVLSADTEAQLTVLESEIYESQSGNRTLHVTFEPTGNDNVDDIHIYMGLPVESDRPKDRRRKRRRIKAFCQAFDAPISGPLNPKALSGLTGVALLGVEEFEGTERNSIRKFVGGSL